MRIVVSQTLGELGPDQGPPVFFEWRWHHYGPGWSLWILIALVLLGRKANRTWQAWLILIPLFVVTGLWHVSVRLVSIPSSTAELAGILVSSWAVGWSVVWLVADRLAGYRRVAAFALALAVMLSIGAWAHAAHFGWGDTDELLPLLLAVGLCVLVLLVAMALSSFSCRRRYRPGRFMAWLLLWTLVASEVTALAIYDSIATAVGPRPEEWIELLVMSPVLGGALYLANLPFMILAFHCPLYGDRFRKLFHVREPFEIELWRETVSYGAPASTDATTKPVHLHDVVGPWQFYLDHVARTVIVDFRADGTFGQTILANQGAATECPGGTWRLEGPKVHLTDYVSARSGKSESRTWWMVDAPSGLVLAGGDDRDWCFRMTRAPRTALHQAAAGPA